MFSVLPLAQTKCTVVFELMNEDEGRKLCAHVLGVQWAGSFSTRGQPGPALTSCLMCEKRGFCSSLSLGAKAWRTEESCSVNTLHLGGNEREVPGFCFCSFSP